MIQIQHTCICTHMYMYNCNCTRDILTTVQKTSTYMCPAPRVHRDPPRLPHSPHHWHFRSSVFSAREAHARSTSVRAAATTTLSPSFTTRSHGCCCCCSGARSAYSIYILYFFLPSDGLPSDGDPSRRTGGCSCRYGTVGGSTRGTASRGQADVSPPLVAVDVPRAGESTATAAAAAAANTVEGAAPKPLLAAAPVETAAAAPVAVAVEAVKADGAVASVGGREVWEREVGAIGSAGIDAAPSSSNAVQVEMHRDPGSDSGAAVGDRGGSGEPNSAVETPPPPPPPPPLLDAVLVGIIIPPPTLLPLCDGDGDADAAAKLCWWPMEPLVRISLEKLRFSCTRQLDGPPAAAAATDSDTDDKADRKGRSAAAIGRAFTAATPATTAACLSSLANTASSDSSTSRKGASCASAQYLCAARSLSLISCSMASTMRARSTCHCRSAVPITLPYVSPIMATWRI